MVAAKNWMTGNEYTICTLGNIIVLIWTAFPSVDGVQACAAAFSTLRREEPTARIGLLSIVESEAGHGAMDPAVRNALGKMLKENESVLRAAAIVFEAQGFRATVIRSVVTAINMASRLGYPTAVFSDRLSGAKWLVMEQMAGHSSVTMASLSSLLRSTRSANSALTP